MLYVYPTLPCPTRPHLPPPPPRFLQCLQGWKAKLSEAGYDAIVFEDPLDMLLQQVQAILISPTGQHHTTHTAPM